jgi:transcriptional regulator with XRE-family HTH domain
MVSIGENLRRLRKSRGLSQADLSQAASVPQQTIARIELEKVQNPRGLAQLAAALDCSIEELDPRFAPTVGRRAAEGEVDFIMGALEEHARKLERELGFLPTPKQTLLHLMSNRER